MKKLACYILLSLAMLVIAGCHDNSLPVHRNNLCRLFREKPTWYWQTERVRHRWGLPISVQMAIIHQESHYQSAAQPPRRKLFGVIPWFRPTTAQGFCQALDSTWRLYLKSQGKLSGGRDDFDDASDFIGWYTHLARQKLGIKPTNAFALYLAYHEGIGGYQRRTYHGNPDLIAVAHKVSRYSHIYRQQLLSCEKRLPKKPWWRFW